MSFWRKLNKVIFVISLVVFCLGVVGGSTLGTSPPMSLALFAFLLRLSCSVPSTPILFHRVPGLSGTSLDFVVIVALFRVFV